MNVVAETSAGEVPSQLAQTLVCEVPTRESPTEHCAKGIVRGLTRRLARERRRRKVGRAYDMALEIARIVPKDSAVLDVGCGNGFIAHHLSAMLGREVVGIDVMDTTEAPIDYRRYDGRQLPVEDNSVDAVLLCYVLHHTQDAGAVLRDVRRALTDDGLAIIYEDIPLTFWDKAVCWIHNRKWQRRSGLCAFRTNPEWRDLLSCSGFELLQQRVLSRSRNLTHLVSRSLYVVRRVG